MLDLFFRKYAWTANLVLIFAAAWLCALITNTAVGAAIRPQPTVDLTVVPNAAQAPPSTPQIAPDKLYALIGQKPPAQANLGDVGQPRAEQNCANSAATPTKSGLRAQLVAAVVAEQPSQSFASITDLNSRETRIYGVGDDVQGASLLSVERMRDDGDGLGTGFKIVAIVCNSGRKEFLDFEQAEGSPQAHSPASMRAADAPGDPNEAVKKVSDNRYELPKKFIDDTLHNLNAVATQARIVPSFKNGVANGFKVFSIQPGSLYSNIGVENGDVIQRINGYEMNSPDKALEIYQKLQDAPHISIEIERNGQMIRKEYSITGS